MKKPEGWEDLKSHELTPLIHRLNVWNANQPVPESVHNAHFKSEMEPLIKLRDKLNQAWVNKGSAD